MTKRAMIQGCGFVLLLTLCPLSFAQKLSGAGATFPAPIYKKWFEDYRKSGGARVSYRAVGSGAGIEEFLKGSVDFAASDAPLTDEQLTKAKAQWGCDILHFPTVVGAIVPIYNVPGISADLNFTREALAGIFLGKIRRWNDPQLVDVNPDIGLRDEPIEVVHRGDSSGSTYTFTEYLSFISPEWKSGPGTGMRVKWPLGLSAKGNEGVVGVIENLWDSIGYVELSYAMDQHLPHGLVQNAAGQFVAATPKSLTAAANSNSEAIPDDFRLDIVNPKARDAYPIASYTWLIVPVRLREPQKTKALQDLLRWMLTEGQKSAESLYYAKLPEALRLREIDALSKLVAK